MERRSWWLKVQPSERSGAIAVNAARPWMSVEVLLPRLALRALSKCRCIALLGCALIVVVAVWHITARNADVPSGSSVLTPARSEREQRPSSDRVDVLPLPFRDGSAGDVYCDCNVGNYNNQLITCKVCAAFAYAANRRLRILPWCEQRSLEAVHTGDCNEVAQLFSLQRLNELIPTISEPVPPAGGPALRVGLPCDDSAWAHGLTNAHAASLPELERLVGGDAFPRITCMQPAWFHDPGDKCNARSSYGMQLHPQLLLNVAAYWQPAVRIAEVASRVQERAGGPYLALHVRRSQDWLPDEANAWAGGFPDVTLPMESIISIVQFELARQPALQGRVIIATNSRNATEMALLQSAPGMNVQRFHRDVDIAAVPMTNVEAVAVDATLLGRGTFMIGTPGSTFMENVRHVHAQRGPPRIATLCQYRAALPHLWPRCPLPVRPLKGVVLAISFSFPYYDNVPLLTWMYQAFEHVFFCGPEADQNGAPPPAGVHPMNVGAGWYQYRCLLAAMAAFPNQRGYFGSNDDLILHPWVIQTWDFSRPWLEPCKRYANINQPGLVRNDYLPTLEDGLGDPFPWGKPALRAAHVHTSNSFRAQLAVYTGGSDIYCEGDPDFIYLPAGTAERWAEAVQPFDAAGAAFIYVYHSVLRGLVPDADIVKPNGTWMWGDDQRAAWATLYSSSAPLVHPMKLSNPDQRRTVVQAFAKHLQLPEMLPANVLCPDAELPPL